MAKASDPLERIYRLLSERSRIEKEFREAEQQFRKVADEAVTELKSTILSLCEAAGTTVSDLFGYVSDAVGGSDPAPAAAPDKKKAGRPKKAAVVADAAPVAAPVPAKKAGRPAKAAKPVKAVKAAKSGKGSRTKGLGKYLLDGKAYDGREARAVAAFDFVRTDGLIDDTKALAARVINPEWLTTPSVASKKFVAEYKLDVAGYVGGN